MFNDFATSRSWSTKDLFKEICVISELGDIWREVAFNKLFRNKRSLGKLPQIQQQIRPHPKAICVLQWFFARLTLVWCKFSNLKFVNEFRRLLGKNWLNQLKSANYWLKSAKTWPISAEIGQNSVKFGYEGRLSFHS